MTKMGSGQDGGIGRNPSLPHTTKMKITTSPKSINNQKHQKIKLHGTPTTKKKINQNNQTSTAADHVGWLRKAVARWRATQAGLTEGKTETQRWLWAVAVAIAGESPSLTEEFVGKQAREEHGSRQPHHCLPAPPQQAAPQWSKEGCPALVNT